MSPAYSLRSLQPGDLPWLRARLDEHWGSPEFISRGKVHPALGLAGIVACRAGEPVGVLLYSVEGDELEVVLVEAFVEGTGIGTLLLTAARAEAVLRRCRRLWLVTTNDNRPAIEFYQRRGLRIVAVRRGAMAESRRLKPSIPLLGVGGVPIEDEVEMELAIG